MKTNDILKVATGASSVLHKAINNKTRPITDAGIGIGMKLSIIFDKSMMIASTST